MRNKRIKCFFLVPTHNYEILLRRFVWSDKSSHCTHMGYHNATVPIGNKLLSEGVGNTIGDDHPHDDKRWPIKCSCGYKFKESDQWQHLKKRTYYCSDTKEHMTLQNAPPGAMWYADWLPYEGPDGRSLVVRIPPNHDWVIDGMAKNCTKKEDKLHRCWVRHGAPPNITVDKLGNTCAAGAGSISTHDWHGFLRNGYLEEC